MYSGRCHCGLIEFKINLPKPLESYHPRRCDCDFCVQHKILFLSDPNGYFEINKNHLTNFLVQGDQNARFAQCKKCQAIIAAYYISSDRLYSTDSNFRGVINSQLLVDKAILLAPVDVSPNYYLLKPSANDGAISGCPFDSLPKH